MRVLLVFSLLLCWAIPAWSAGLEVGATVTVKRKNLAVIGVLTHVDPDKEPLEVITPKNGSRSVWLKDVQRITPTGETLVIAPGQAGLVRQLAVNILRFEMVNGGVFEGGLVIWPVFEVEAKGARTPFRLDRLASIETGQAQTAPGFTIGSKVRSVVAGESIIGTIVALNFARPDDSIMVLTAAGESVMLPMRELKRIQLVTPARESLPLIPTAKPNPPQGFLLYEIITVMGRKIQGRILQPPVFSIDTGKGIRKNIWNDIEVIEKQ